MPIKFKSKITRPAAFIGILIGIISLNAQAGDADMAAMIKRFGIQAVEPPSPASDFTLIDSQGGSITLSNYAGNLVVLTFFATWCGSCTMAMPTIQKLHIAQSGKSLKMIAIAIDGNASQLKAYAQQHKITFPLLLDPSSQTINAYHAHSIPITYLIDPKGRIVGVARGARDWSLSTRFFDDLQSMSLSLTAPAVQYQSQGDTVALASKLVPPDATYSLLSDLIIVKQTFSLEIHVEWAGHLADYILHPPTVQLPEAIVLENISASSHSQAGKQHITYQLLLQAHEQGEFALDPIELRYTPRYDKSPVTRRIDGPKIMVQPVTFLGIKQSLAVIIVVGSLLVGLGAMWIFRRIRKSPTASVPAANSSLGFDVEKAYEQARKARLEGRIEDFLQLFKQIQPVIKAHDAFALDKELDNKIEQVRYGGQRLDDEELTQMLRLIERCVLRNSSSSKSAQKEEIRLFSNRE